MSKCDVKAIEERERSVRQEEILGFECSVYRGMAMLVETEMMSSDAITPSCIGSSI